MVLQGVTAILRLGFALAALAWHIQAGSDSLPIKSLGTLFSEPGKSWQPGSNGLSLVSCFVLKAEVCQINPPAEPGVALATHSQV